LFFVFLNLRFGFSGTAKSKPEIIQKAAIRNSMYLRFQSVTLFVPQNIPSIQIRRGQK
jgi:hypothetical protein